jgi:radical SAM superfamily enzyme YgiQ (UPF0313 family)
MTRTVEQELDEYQPDVVAISAVSQNFNRVAPYAQAAKARGKAVLVGGIHVSMLPECLPQEADAGCIGEGEETFAELMRVFVERGRFSEEALSGVRGIAYRSKGRLVLTESRPLIANLDEIPHPKRDLSGYPSHSYMFTSRGCPYRCSFCASTRFWDRMRFATAGYVIEEIEELAAHGVKTISFYDDLFVANLRRLEEIAEQVAARGLDRKVRFTCSCRANVVNERVVTALAKMNVVSVGMGLESGNDRTLEFLKGGVTVADNRKAVELLKAGGIQANASFVIGSPDETEEEVMDTYRFIAASKLDFVDTYVLTPLPGTPVWEDALARGLVSNDMDWSRLDVNFAASKDRAVIVSKRLDREGIKRLFARFRRQRLWRILKALPGSPWLADVPRVAWGMAAGHIGRLWQRLTGRNVGR